MTSMPTVPTIGSSDTGLVQIQGLQSLANAVAFLTNMDYSPSFHLFRNATQTLAASGSTLVLFTQASYDPAGMSNGTGVTIPLAGVYHFKAVIPLETNTTTYFNDVFFQFTAGANNPNFAASTTRVFGGRSSLAVTQATTDTVLSCGAACPTDLYPGDTVSVGVYNPVASTLVINKNQNTNPWSGRWVPSFMGKWIRATI